MQRCIMHDHPFEIATVCKQCCMLLRYGVVCHWLGAEDTTELITAVLRRLIITKKGERMFFTKDKKGKYELHPGIINMLNPTEALKDVNIMEIEEIYEISRVSKPVLEPRLKTIEGLPVPAQPRKRRSSAQVAADKKAAAAAAQPTEAQSAETPEQ